MFGILDAIKVGLGAFCGGVLVLAWALTIHDANVRADATTLANAKAAENTKHALNEITDSAEKARAMRRFCSESGKLYDFQANQCRDP